MSSVGGIRGGGKGGVVKGPLGPGRKSGAGKASAGTFGKVDSTQKLVRVTGLAGTSEVGAADPVSLQAVSIAKALKSGEIASKAEAAQRLVASILKERLRVQSKSLSKKIAEHMQDDPRLSQTLDRIWARGRGAIRP